MTLGLGVGTWALSVGGSDGWTALPSVGGVAALALLGLFDMVEKRLRDKAMMPLAMFLGRTFIGLTLLTALIHGSLGAPFVLLPFKLIQSAHYSATAAGAALFHPVTIPGLDTAEGEASLPDGLSSDRKTADHAAGDRSAVRG